MTIINEGADIQRYLVWGIPVVNSFLSEEIIWYRTNICDLLINSFQKIPGKLVPIRIYNFEM